VAKKTTTARKITATVSAENARRHLDESRKTLALCMFGLLLLIIVANLVAAANNWPHPEIVTQMYSGVTGLMGATLAFYFKDLQ